MQKTLTRMSRVLANTLSSSTARPTADSVDFAPKTVPPSRRTRRSVIQSACGLEPLESRTLMSTTYYVSSSGSDSNRGTTTSAPFKTVAGVNAHSFSSGDQVLFQGGQSFSGSLSIKGKDTGVTFGSYGSGNATINSGGASAVSVHEVGNLKFTNLNFIGTGNADGLAFNDVGGGTLTGPTLTNITVSGYGGDGLYFQSSSNGWTGTHITYYTGHNLGGNGINFSGSSENTTNVYIGYSTAYDCTHSGFVLTQVNGATIEHSLAYNDGTDGALGFEASQANNVTWQYNVAHNNKSNTGLDGGGFDFDWDTTNSTMQSNYSYDNGGHGYQLNQIDNGTSTSGDTIKNNVSINDARTNSYAGIGVWGKVTNAVISGNYISISPSSGATPQGIKVHNSTETSQFVSNVAISGNTIMTSGNVPMITVPAAEVAHASNLKFSGNVYWSGSSKVNISYNGSTYSSLSSYQSATKQDSGASTRAVNTPSLSFVSNIGATGTSASAPAAPPVTTTTTTTTTTPTAPKTSTISGTVTGGSAGETVYLDANNNAKLDSGEHSTTTSSTGTYTFSSVPAGAYIIRQELASGYSQTSPTSGLGIHITAANGNTLTGQNFTDKSTSTTPPPSTTTASISGTVTGGVAGETVYLDANNNAKLDSDELSTTTSSNGTYTFSSVPAGAYIVRQELTSGYSQTSPSGNLGIHLTVAKGSKLTGENFTDKSIGSTVTSSTPHTKLTGTTIGTAGSYDNSGNTIAKATDGSTSTFFDAAASDGDWVGLNLGSSKTISQIEFAPRSGYASRMKGGVFQVSTTANFSSGVTTIYTIASTPVAGLTTITLSTPVTAEYVRYLSPNSGHGNISEFEVLS